MVGQHFCKAALRELEMALVVPERVIGIESNGGDVGHRPTLIFCALSHPKSAPQYPHRQISSPAGFLWVR